MNVRIEKVFPIPASTDKTWLLLQDIPGVASCLPGASVIECVDASHYKGQVAVKVGPASMLFRGEVEVKTIDPASHVMRLVGKGTDSTGSSGASLDLTARIEAVDATSCNLVGSSDVSISGKAAAFGGRMMNTVADQVLNQFAANFAAKVQALNAPITESPPAPTQLNALALAWAILKDWLRSLFSPKKA